METRKERDKKLKEAGERGPVLYVSLIMGQAHHFSLRYTVLVGMFNSISTLN